ncbi:MAG: hypothetical protein IT359_16360 [Gemmatimonadaceae bacterium]|nr:hypothetical protein [Gemmatimonadaceae bacterium]
MATTAYQQHQAEVSGKRVAGSMATIMLLGLCLSKLPILGGVIAGYVGGRVAQTRAVGQRAVGLTIALTTLMLLPFASDLAGASSIEGGLLIAAAFIGWLIGSSILYASVMWGVRGHQRRVAMQSSSQLPANE